MVVMRGLSLAYINASTLVLKERSVVLCAGYSKYQRHAYLPPTQPNPKRDSPQDGSGYIAL